MLRNLQGPGIKRWRREGGDRTPPTPSRQAVDEKYAFSQFEPVREIQSAGIGCQGLRGHFSGGSGLHGLHGLHGSKKKKMLVCSPPGPSPPAITTNGDAVQGRHLSNLAPPCSASICWAGNAVRGDITVISSYKQHIYSSEPGKLIYKFHFCHMLLLMLWRKCWAPQNSLFLSLSYYIFIMLFPFFVLHMCNILPLLAPL